MASRPSPNSLIHCTVCGEDYSATYRRCPFCGAKNAPTAPPVHTPLQPMSPTPAPPSDPDDNYVFDGQDLFDDDYEEDYAPARPKGGKRLADKPSSNPFADAQINWPRMITFLCSLVIIVAALIIVFTVIYPQLHGSKDPDSTVSDQPSDAVTDPVGPATDPVGEVSDPVAPPSAEPPVVEPPVAGPTSIQLNITDFTLRPESAPVQLTATFTPADWSGPVTWTSTDEELAMVSPEGLVSHAKPDVTGVHLVIITATAGDQYAQCKVYIAGSANSSQPPASNPPAVASQPPSSGGTVTVGRTGTIVGADSGLRVRSGPGTSYDVVASLLNGNTVNVISDAGGGWYQISFSGSGGSTITGYIMGEYISN